MQHKWIVLVSGLTLAVMVGFSIPIAMAQTSSEEAAVQLEIPAGAESGPQFDIDTATEAYINLLSPKERAKSNAYFEGGYWLKLWGF